MLDKVSRIKALAHKMIDERCNLRPVPGCPGVTWQYRTLFGTYVIVDDYYVTSRIMTSATPVEYMYRFKDGPLREARFAETLLAAVTKVEQAFLKDYPNVIKRKLELLNP